MLGGCFDIGGCVFFFQAEDGIRDLVRSRGLGDVYKRQRQIRPLQFDGRHQRLAHGRPQVKTRRPQPQQPQPCLLYTSDAADERSSVDLGGRRIIKKKNTHTTESTPNAQRETISIIQYNLTEIRSTANQIS